MSIDHIFRNILDFYTMVCFSCTFGQYSIVRIVNFFLLKVFFMISFSCLTFVYHLFSYIWITLSYLHFFQTYHGFSEYISKRVTRNIFFNGTIVIDFFPFTIQGFLEIKDPKSIKFFNFFKRYPSALFIVNILYCFY